MNEKAIRRSEKSDHARSKMGINLRHQIKAINDLIVEYLGLTINHHCVDMKIIPVRNLQAGISKIRSQIEHELCRIKAINILFDAEEINDTNIIQWSSPQIDNAIEPDFCVLREGKFIFSCELTIIEIPEAIDHEKTTDVLRQLNLTEGRKIFFVVTEQMKEIFEAEVQKNGYHIHVVNLNSKNGLQLYSD